MANRGEGSAGLPSHLQGGDGTGQGIGSDGKGVDPDPVAAGALGGAEHSANVVGLESPVGEGRLAIRKEQHHFFAIWVVAGAHEFLAGALDRRRHVRRALRTRIEDRLEGVFYPGVVGGQGLPDPGGGGPPGSKQPRSVRFSSEADDAHPGDARIESEQQLPRRRDFRGQDRVPQIGFGEQRPDWPEARRGDVTIAIDVGPARLASRLGAIDHQNDVESGEPIRVGECATRDEKSTDPITDTGARQRNLQFEIHSGRRALRSR